MKKRYHIRPYAKADFPAIDAIRAAAFAPVFASFREIVGPSIADVAFRAAEKEQADHLHSICQPDSTSEVFVVEADGAVVAFCAFTKDNASKLGEIGLNATHPDHQGQGVGTMMYEFAMQRMREAGMKAVTVGTGGDASHAPARRAYEKAGFTAGIPSVHLYREL